MKHVLWISRTSLLRHTQFIHRHRSSRFSLDWTLRYYNSAIYVTKIQQLPWRASRPEKSLISLHDKRPLLGKWAEETRSCFLTRAGLRIGCFYQLREHPTYENFHPLTPCFLLRRWWLDGRKDARGEVGAEEEVVGPCRLLPKPAEVDLSTRNECARR